MKKVLIIEDDVAISKLLEFHLIDLNYTIIKAFKGDVGLEKALNDDFTLIILDITLPNIDGIEVCKQIRLVKQTPIIMLTAKTEELDKVLSLELGADDYITKPFSVREFIARVKAVTRRFENTSGTKKIIESNNELTFKELSINIDKRKVLLKNKEINLSPIEFDLLVLMASNAGKVYSREKLLELVWGYDFDGYRHTVNSHINRLRGKIEENMVTPKFILTTWGVGYKFNDELKIPSHEKSQSSIE
ncbi:DNA-binding response regulator, OmpR family, contains REC and winged-helix (wHTH) domain [Tenacibaculum sp. MAR_2010_89]|uniref:response regulator transcription factor n=1 Tax=Tenacibaculum sp. MAR_2010_89 TaxID=1250198 RepID=UPI000897D3AB|nr:response regulator transcription factor [Tenacibaculum sp. MAR_2010_89]SEE53808.1 DNA-binding response regulator, OmpR family, contains REC and winged-helix (wHTH) domain [Tenacibaculum sp. MAR_2010_89]